MAQHYRSPPNRPESWRGDRYASASDRERRRGGEARFDPQRDEGSRHSRAFEGDRSHGQGGYSEEFGHRRSRHRDDNHDRDLGRRYYGSRGANDQSGRSYDSDFDQEDQSRFDAGRFDEDNRFSEASRDSNYPDRDLGGPEFTLTRDRGSSTSRWRADEGDDGGYFSTGSYVDDGGSWRGFGRDFERARARAQQESDFGSFRSRDRDRETSGDYGYYAGLPYGSQANYGRDDDERSLPRQRYGSYADRSNWSYGSPQRAGSGSAGGAYDRGFEHEPRGYGSQRQSFRGRGPQGYQRSDDRLKELICERLTDDPAIDASDVSIDVTGQCVKLTGTVDDRSTKYEIEELVESFGGVKDLDNQLRVRSSRSSFGQSSGSTEPSGGGNDWDAGSTSASGSTSGATTGAPTPGTKGRKN